MTVDFGTASNGTSRGGSRPLLARGDTFRVYASGRRGPRRVRVTECVSVIRAEAIYAALVRDGKPGVRAGAQGSALFTLDGEGHTLLWEVRDNAVWRHGRVFLNCPSCRRRCSRLYVPLRTSAPACRACWGLTYASKTLQNYKDSPLGRGALARMLGTTQREWAYTATEERRAARRQRQ